MLTELGKEWATVEVPYAGGGTPPRIEGRTIHADGTVVPLNGKAEDLLVEKSTSRHLDVRVFTLPSVEVGSILEYRWTLPNSELHTVGVTNDAQGFMDSALAGSIPYWDVQTSIPIRKEHFYYNPLGDLERNVIGNQTVTHYNSRGEIAHYLLFSARLPAGAHVQPSPNKDYVARLAGCPGHSPRTLYAARSEPRVRGSFLLQSLSERRRFLGQRRKAVGARRSIAPRSPPPTCVQLPRRSPPEPRLKTRRRASCTTPCRVSKTPLFRANAARQSGFRSA